ncbi:MAG: inosine/xanthosine triphosphatase [Anaerolineae bacterium]|nr:inosine/xanthosine triphosphatase [Anaerolineae bacterium]
MHIAIGSTNPIKIGAAERVMSALYPDARFSSVEVASGVAVQPRGDLETRTGAINRAVAAQQATDAEFGIGFEGGIVELDMGMFVCAWAAIAAKDDRIGVGGGNNMLLPNAVADLVRGGLELGEAMDQLFKTQDLSHREGAIGTFTDGLITRQDSFEYLLKMALAPFRTERWYREIRR